MIESIIGLTTIGALLIIYPQITDIIYTKDVFAPPKTTKWVLLKRTIGLCFLLISIIITFSLLKS